MNAATLCHTPTFGYEQYLLQYPMPGPARATLFPSFNQQRKYAPIGTPTTPYVISRVPWVTAEQTLSKIAGAKRSSGGGSHTKQPPHAAVTTTATTSDQDFLAGGSPDFFRECVRAAPFIPSAASQEEHRVGGYNWSPLEWKARAEYWREQAESLVFKSEHFKTKSTELGVQLGTCTLVLQMQTEQTTKDTQKLLDSVRYLTTQRAQSAETLRIVQDENSRLAVLLSTYICKAQAHDDVKARLDRSLEEKQAMEKVIESMSAAMSGFLKKGSDEAASDQFCGSFFASHPCDEA
jgi:hypothetical protein